MRDHYVGSVIYCLVLHPLAKYPGPLLSKISVWPSYYHTFKGDRHIWIWQCHQIYGPVFRYRPDGLVFNSPKANRDIYGSSGNVKKGIFYDMYPRKAGFNNTWNCTDKAKHARKRRILNAAFSDKALKNYESYIVQHADRWCELLLDGGEVGWSAPRDMAEWSDWLVFDILGELCYATSFNTKEPGDNELKSVPSLIGEYSRFVIQLSTAPFTKAWVWLKPKGLDKVMEKITPANAQAYLKFTTGCLLNRLEEENAMQSKGRDEDDVRKDFFHYLFRAKDPESGGPGYTQQELFEESSLLVAAGADTTSTTFAAMFFYLTRNPKVYETLTNEIRKTFKTSADIHAGPQLSSCRYLRATINEALRMNPPVAAEPNREALAGGVTVDDHHVQEGTNIGVSIYSLQHNEDIYPDPFVFRPERWIPDESTGVTAESVAVSESAFAPFSLGPRGCPGKNLAYTEMSITMAKVLYLADVQAVEGDDLGADGQRQPPQFAGGLPFGDTGQRFFGLPSPITRPTSQLGIMDIDPALAGYSHTASVLDYSQANRAFQMAQNSTSPPVSSNPFSPNRQRKTLRFADDDDDELPNTANSATETMTFREQLHHAFALHALLQGHGTGLQNPIPQKLKMNPPRQRTLILGHKAGLYLTDYRYDAFCAVAKALALHEQQTFGYVRDRCGWLKEAGGFAVEIEGDIITRRRGGNAFRFSQKTFRDNYEREILPLLRRNDVNKPQIRVRAETELEADHVEVPNCGFICDCDDSRELELVALDVGYLRVLANWHRWGEEAQLLTNSRVFETTMFELLFPGEAFVENYYMLELPDGESYRLQRGTEPLLSGEIQEALSHLTTRGKQAGVVPRKVKLWPVKGPLMERSQSSPARRSPALARAQGAILVHRPARLTHFIYDAPHTMERFFALARAELYPNTKGKLQLRLSPSHLFQEEGKLLAPIVESEVGYTTVDSTGETLEDWWKREMLDRWLSPQEDVWAIKIIDSILVKDGTDLTKQSEEWDLSALKGIESDDDDDEIQETWSIPPESLSARLAQISKTLLHIDPRKSSEGILLHVMHDQATGHKKEWLRWNAGHSFTHFLNEVLYKIDGDTTAIYPGDYLSLIPNTRQQEETTDSTRALMTSTAHGMREAVTRDGAVTLQNRRIRGYLSDEEEEEEYSRPSPKKKPQTQDSTTTASSSREWDCANVKRLEGQELEDAMNKHRNNPFATRPRNPARDPTPDFALGAVPPAIFNARHAPPPLPLPPARETSAADMGLLRQRLHRAENELLQREHTCRVCGTLITQLTEEVVQEHYRTHASPARRPCPHEECDEDLEDRARYPTFQVDTPSLPPSYQPNPPTDSPAHQQTQDHLNLHPITSTARQGGVQEGRRLPRSTATQTYPFPHWQEPRRTRNEPLHLRSPPAERHRKVLCNKCKLDVTRLSQKNRTTHATNCKTTPSKFVEVSSKHDTRKYLPAPAAAERPRTTPQQTKGGTRGEEAEATTAAGPDAPESSETGQGRKDARRSRRRTGAKAAEEPEESVAAEEDAEAAGAEDGASKGDAGKTTKRDKEKTPNGETSAPGRVQPRRGKTPVPEEEPSTAAPAQGSPVKRKTPKKAAGPSKPTAGAGADDENTAPTPRRGKGRPPKKAPETIRVTDEGVIPVAPAPAPASNANPATSTASTDYSSMKNSELADMLKARGLHYSGNKAALVARLEMSDREGEGTRKGAGQMEVPDSQESALQGEGSGVPDEELLGPDTEGEGGNGHGAATTAKKGKRKRKETGRGKGAAESPKKRKK
ncbi:MAG: hypothetical protein Q9208_006027 [Pyrenodesmia sp. 3 TL-2023]